MGAARRFARRVQNVEFAASRRLRSTFCTDAVQNIESGSGSAWNSTFCARWPHNVERVR
jgi:hypothetical protein